MGNAIQIKPQSRLGTVVATYPLRGVLARALLGVFLCMFLGAFLYGPSPAQGAEPPQCAVFTKAHDVSDPAFTTQFSAAIDQLKLENSQNCFDKLTAADKTFLGNLAENLSAACKAELTAKQSPEACESAAHKAMTEAFEAYRKEQGTAAHQRVLTAIAAQSKKQEIGAALKIFQDPQIAPAFAAFANAMESYKRSLARVTFEDLASDKPESAWREPLTWVRQRVSMGLDLAKTKLSQTAKSRFREHEKAAEALAFSGIGLKGKIQELALSDVEKKHLLKQVDLLLSSMREQYETKGNKLQAEARLAAVATGGVASAALIVASAGNLAPVFISAVGGQVTAAVAGGAATAAVASAGISSLTHVADLTLSARVEADHNATTFVCELSRRIGADQKQILEDVWRSTWQAGLAGVAIGGPIAGVALKAPRVASFIGTLLTVNGGVAVTSSLVRNQRQITRAGQKAEEAKAALARGQGTAGGVKDAEHARDQENAKTVSKAVGAVAAGAMLTYGKVSANKRPSSETKKTTQPSSTAESSKPHPAFPPLALNPNVKPVPDSVPISELDPGVAPTIARLREANIKAGIMKTADNRDVVVILDASKSTETWAKSAAKLYETRGVITQIDSLTSPTLKSNVSGESIFGSKSMVNPTTPYGEVILSSKLDFKNDTLAGAAQHLAVGRNPIYTREIVHHEAIHNHIRSGVRNNTSAPDNALDIGFTKMSNSTSSVLHPSVPSGYRETSYSVDEVVPAVKEARIYRTAAQEAQEEGNHELAKVYVDRMREYLARAKGFTEGSLDLLGQTMNALKKQQVNPSPNVRIVRVQPISGSEAGAHVMVIVPLGPEQNPTMVTISVQDARKFLKKDGSYDLIATYPAVVKTLDAAIKQVKYYQGAAENLIVPSVYVDITGASSDAPGTSAGPGPGAGDASSAPAK